MIIAIVGTGTEVGKTHVASSLLRHLRASGQPVVGWKPMESGVTGPVGADEDQLRQACGVDAPTLRFVEPLAPHLAARRHGLEIDRDRLRAVLEALVARWPIVVVELAGGWFSPFDDQLDNAEWLAALAAPLRRELRPVLVAPDRLGVLHEVSATWRAAASLGLSPVAIALTPAAIQDASSGDNASELARRSLTRAVPIVAVPRGTCAELATSAAIAELATCVMAAGPRER